MVRACLMVSDCSHELLKISGSDKNKYCTTNFKDYNTNIKIDQIWPQASGLTPFHLVQGTNFNWESFFNNMMHVHNAWPLNQFVPTRRPIVLALTPGWTESVKLSSQHQRGWLTTTAAAPLSPSDDGDPILLQVAASRASGDGGASYPQWAGFKRRKWVAVSPEPHRKYDFFTTNFKTCELHKAPCTNNNPGRRACEKGMKKIPDLLCYHLAAESRLDCCPRLRQPFPLVSLAVQGLQKATVRRKQSKTNHLARHFTSLDNLKNITNTRNNLRPLTIIRYQRDICEARGLIS